MPESLATDGRDDERRSSLDVFALTDMAEIRWAQS